MLFCSDIVRTCDTLLSHPYLEAGGPSATALLSVFRLLLPTAAVVPILRALRRTTTPARRRAADAGAAGEGGGGGAVGETQRGGGQCAHVCGESFGSGL